MERVKTPISKAGFAGIVGLPNVGKSTLVNRLTDTKLSIVSSKAQTTRNTVSLILTLPNAQIIFQDTPGFHEATSALNQAFVESVLRTIKMTDIIVFVIDPTTKESDQGEEVERLVSESGKPIILAINKIDTLDKKFAEDLVSKRLSNKRFSLVLGISALTGYNCDLLIKGVTELLPIGPYLYSEDDLSDMPERFFATELIREQILKLLVQEVPHKTAVTIETFKEIENRVLIQANIHVERDSQKKILIGRGGNMIKSIGTAARQRIEEFLERSVRLELFVKVSPNWTRSINKLKEFGYLDSK
ncbi:MAG: GTPase Era [Desulfomonilaceae bacterium]|jgi:GTP-binding protein Era|nr:GTPase Era [Syntrophaceae bacterium]